MGEFLTYYLPLSLLWFGPLVVLFVLECSADLAEGRRKREASGG